MNEKKIGIATQPRTRLQACWTAGILLQTLLMAGCGTTSGFKAASGQNAVDLSPFSRVLVKDFTDSASEKMEGLAREKKAAEMKRVTKDFADMLAWDVGRRVVDRTGLQGPFELMLEWSLDAAVDRRLPPLSIALQEQLGLKLESERAQVDVLLIDRIERPTEN